MFRHLEGSHYGNQKYHESSKFNLGNVTNDIDSSAKDSYTPTESDERVATIDHTIQTSE